MRHRNDGGFAGTDARHTRADRVAFAGNCCATSVSTLSCRSRGQRGRVHQIDQRDVANAPPRGPRGGERSRDTPGPEVVSIRSGLDTVERHRRSRRHGAVWWGRLGTKGSTGLADRWITEASRSNFRTVPETRSSPQRDVHVADEVACGLPRSAYRDRANSFVLRRDGSPHAVGEACRLRALGARSDHRQLRPRSIGGTSHCWRPRKSGSPHHPVEELESSMEASRQALISVPRAFRKVPKHLG